MEKQKYEDHKYDPPAGCFLRLFWMMIGNLILLFCAYGIIQHRSSVLSIADAFYWAIVGSLLAARYVDIRYFYGLTAGGDPATMAHWCRYATVLGAVSTGLWLGAHAIAYYGTQKATKNGAQLWKWGALHAPSFRTPRLSKRT